MLKAWRWSYGKLLREITDMKGQQSALGDNNMIKNIRIEIEALDKLCQASNVNFINPDRNYPKGDTT